MSHTNYFGSGSIQSERVVVGVIDGMMRNSHQEFEDKVITTVLSAGGTYNNPANHATHVAGTIGGARNGDGDWMVGVDPWADFVNIALFDDYGWVGPNDDYALNQASLWGARVVNMSYGPTTPGLLTFREDVVAWAAHSDIVIVKAAGNSGQRLSPVYYGGTAETDLSHLLIVGSVTSSNQMNSWSNTPGNSCFYSKAKGRRAVCDEGNKFKYFFIVAPGSQINSSIATADNAYGLMSGTSMAAPHVAGAAALLLSIWPHLSATDAASILKLSATDLGESGVDDVFGWGLLNVDSAVKNPIGDLTIAIAVPLEEPKGGGGGGGNGGGNSGKKPKAVQIYGLGAQRAGGRINMRSLAGALDGLTGFDAFGRDFTGSHVADDYEAGLSSFSYIEEFFGYISASAANVKVRHLQTRPSFRRGLDAPVKDTSKGFWFGSLRGYGGPGLLSEDRSEVSFFEANKRHIVSSILLDGVYAGFYSQVNPNVLFTARISQLRDTEDYNRQGFAADFEMQFKASEKVVFSMGVSYTEEDGSVMGGVGTGAYDLGEGASTVGFEQHVAFKLSDNWFLDLSGMATMTNTHTQYQENSLFSDVGDLWSYGATLQATGHDLILPNDSMSFAIGMPLQSFSGYAVITGGIFDRSTRTMSFEDRRFSIKSSEIWTTSMVHGFAIAKGKATFGYGAYAQFERSEFSEVGLGLSLRMRL